ncbi:MAG: hypothetical protein ACRC8T_05790 [Acidaminococcaceae bacterium]
MKKIVIVFVLLMAMFSAISYASGWSYVTADQNDNKYYLAASTVKVIKDNDKERIISTLVKTEYSDIGRYDLISNRKDHNLPVDGLEYLAYKIERTEFRLKDNKLSFRIKESTAYDRNGDVIGDMGHFYSWIDVGDNSVYKYIYNTAVNR